MDATNQRKNFALTPEIRSDVRAALDHLQGSGISLLQAAQIAMQGRRAVTRIVCDDAVGLLLREVLRRKSRPDTYRWYEEKLGVWLKTFGGRMLDEISRAELTTWRNALGCEHESKRHYAKAVRALFRWAIAHEPPMLGNDVTVGFVPKPLKREKEIAFFSAAQCEKLLRNAGVYQSTIALGLFAGIRPEEFAGKGKPWLKWEHVDTEEKRIRVPDTIAKTRKSRLIEHLPNALWQWLTPGKQDEDISPGSARQVVLKCKTILDIDDWPQDVIRHTAATWLMAVVGDAGKVSNWLGHEDSPTLLHARYRGISYKGCLATKAEGQKLYALKRAKATS